MYIKFEDWKVLKSLIDDLFWDIDRMSSGGRYTLNRIDDLMDKLNKNKLNKVYVVVENDVTGDETYNNVIGVTISKKDAKKLFKESVNELKRNFNFNDLEAKDINSNKIDDYDNEWLFSENNDSFTLYLNGEYNSEHFEISIKEVELTFEKDKIKDKELG